MNKLYISPSGVIKVIDVPEEPTVGGCTYQGVADPGTYNAMKSDYQRALAAAKEAGIEVQNREQVVREVFTRPVTGEIVSIPKGWRVEIKRTCKWHGNKDACANETCWDLQECQKSPEKTVAVLLPPVSEKPHNFCVTPGSNCSMNYCDENGCNDRKRNLETKVIAAYARYIRETGATFSLPSD